MQNPEAFCSPEVDIAAVRRSDPDALRRDAEIDSTFAAALDRWLNSPPRDLYGQITLLGELLLFDEDLSVNRDVACTSCHSPSTGFTGGVEVINRTIVAYPGSSNNLVRARKPQSYGYAPFAPILHYNATQQSFYGGNFWDMRATGIQLDNPAAEQAKGPPTNPLEMALPDQACAIYRLSGSRYRALFERVWGEQSFAIRWPADVERICSTPGPPPASDTLPVHLDPVDRGIASRSYDHMVLAMASYEASPAVSPFSSRFDEALAHPDRQVLTADELAGWALFRGKARCNTCHLDGFGQAGAAGEPGRVNPAAAADPAPLFTSFEAVNLGVPKNPALRFYCEDRPVKPGFTPNPQGREYIDLGVGGFLRSTGNPNREWASHADRFDGAVRVPTLRNVDKRPRPDFIKAYMHNGYFKSLEEVVHFYNTRDVLRRCDGPNDPGEKIDCWPLPEVPVNVDSTVGRLGLTAQEVAQLVAFMKTLTDR
jgi:cytochrome c peroxidase